MAQCLNCQSDASPQDARFCVMCGYALQQPCAYRTCPDVTLGTLKAARASCPHCKRFYRVCSHCHRLHTLSETRCRTARCNNQSLTEPFPAFDGAQGDEKHSFSVRVPRAWSPQSNKQFGALKVVEISSLAYRYGWLHWLEGGDVCALKINHLQTSLMPTTTRCATGLVPLEVGFLPHPQALRLAHGFAYVLGRNGAARVAVSQEQAQRLEVPIHDVRDFESTAPADIPPLDSLDWLLQCASDTHWYVLAQSNDELVLLECAAEEAFTPRRLATPDDQSSPVSLLAREGDLYLLTRAGFWHCTDSRWNALWQKTDEFTPQGVLQYGDGWVLWGSDGNRDTQVVWLRPTNISAQFTVFARTIGGSDVLRQPVVMGDWIYFWSHAVDGRSGTNAVLSFNLVSGQTQSPVGFAGAERALWVAGAEGSDSDKARWLVVVVNDGSNVVVRVHALAANGQWDTDTNEWLLAAKWRPQRASFALCDGRFAIATTNAEDTQLQIFGM